MSRAITWVLSPILRLFTSRVDKTTDDPIRDYERYINTLERQLNDVSVSLSGFRARESAARSALDAELVKIDKVAGRIRDCLPEHDMAIEQLEILKKQYEQNSLQLGCALEQAEASRSTVEREYQTLLSAIRKLLQQGDELKARYYTATAKHTLYGDASGVTSNDGLSRLDRLLDRTKRMEAHAQSLFELSPLDIRFDAEITRS